MVRWNSEVWRRPTQTAIYWYLSSNSGRRGVDGGIVLTQTALELLSWTYTVEDRGLITKDGFKRLTASDRLRLLFASLDIPSVIPASLAKLTALQKGWNWRDAMDGLTEVRNSIVHPEHKQYGKYEKAFYEAWNLGLWYLEMVLLRLFDHHGDYGNRLVSRGLGAVVEVPWADKTPSNEAA